MKKMILTGMFFFSTFILLFGQNSLPMGKTQMNAGIGLSEWGIPLYIGFDYAISNDITLGGEFSFRSFHDQWNHQYYDHTIEGLAGNANYHFNNLLLIPNNWDLYAGLNVGFYIWTSSDTYQGSYASGLGLGLQIGGRYFVSKKVALNLEFGSGNAFTNGKFGVTVKL